MKNLYLILRKGSNPTTFDLLKKSAQERGIVVIPIYTEEFDFSQKLYLTSDDAIYKISKDKTSLLIEKYLINKEAVGFYANYLTYIRKTDDAVINLLIHQKLDLPIIKTIFSVTNDKRILSRYVDELSGFPLIIKSMGGQHGVGVMKVDSLDSLYSVVDYLFKQDDSFILRKFIDYKEHARLIVLGNKVISSIEYKCVKDDFRSNVGNKLNIISKIFSNEVEKIAVDSVCSLEYEFGGVDILIDKNNQPFIAEVNFPCYFPRAQEYSGIDISGQMIDYLINKSRR